jgi:hypothetical protein
VTVHGFRSTFKDRCTDQTGYPNEMSEMVKEHAVSDKGRRRLIVAVTRKRIAGG